MGRQTKGGITVIGSKLTGANAHGDENQARNPQAQKTCREKPAKGVLQSQQGSQQIILLAVTSDLPPQQPHQPLLWLEHSSLILQTWPPNKHIVPVSAVGTNQTLI
jgi:hypothetical protein